jgi:hypothetical protein
LSPRILFEPTVLVVAAVYGAVLSFALALGMFGLVLVVFLTLSLWRYSYEVLRKVAQGHREIPAPAMESMSPIGDLGLILHYLFFASALTLSLVTLDQLGFPATLGWLVAAVLLAVFPASAALMAMTQNLAAAFNPVDVVSLAHTLGRRYVRLLAASIALPLVWVTVGALPLPHGLRSLLQCVVGVWVLLAIFAAIGAAVREAREVVEIPGEVIPEAELKARERRKAWREISNRAYASLRSELTGEGYRELERLVEAEQHSEEIYAWVFQELLTWEDTSHALAVARRFVRSLLERGHQHAALDLFKQCRNHAREFPLDVASAAALADYARSIGHDGLADELILTSTERLSA